MPASESQPDQPTPPPVDNDNGIGNTTGDKLQSDGKREKDAALAAKTTDDPDKDCSEPDRFASAFLKLMSRAPGPVFPRARRLYFDKYPLESPQESTPFRTFLLEETIEEKRDGSLRILAQAFALVPWDPQGGQAVALDRVEPGDGERYLQEHWQRSSTGIMAFRGPWFRTESAYLRVAIAANYSSGGGLSSSLSRAGS